MDVCGRLMYFDVRNIFYVQFDFVWPFFLVYCENDMVRNPFNGFTPVNFGEGHSISCVILPQELPDG